MIAPRALYLALQTAWTAAIGSPPEPRQLLVLVAHWALETGNGASCNNYNLAGLKHTPGDGHDYAVYLTREFYGGQWVTVEQQFRAYASLESSAHDYLSVIRGTFGFAWPAVEAGDVLQFAHALKARSYYTAPEGQYAAGLQARYAQMAHACGVELDTQGALANGRPEYVLPVPDRDPPPDAEA